MSRCGLCLRWCIPMADYDDPVCLRCDAGSLKRLPEWAARLPLSFRTGPGRPEDIAELVAAFDSKSGRRRA